MNSYEEFLRQKSQADLYSGFEPVHMPDYLFDFEKFGVDWSVRKGRGALLEDCGLGKTIQELVWAENIIRKTNGKVIILAPLGVAKQFVREGEKFGIDVRRSSDGTVHPNITVTNYERLHYFNPDDFDGVVADESSILKSFTGQTQKDVTRFMSKKQYRLLGTATPAPNDFIELGTSSEALGFLGKMDMLSTFFVNDKNSLFPSSHEYGKKKFIHQGLWRIKGHAEHAFWQWVCSWARACRRPSDWGFSDENFILPPLEERVSFIENEEPLPGRLFVIKAVTLQEQRAELRMTLKQRCEKVAEVVADKPCSVIWCDLNDEGDYLAELIPDSVQIAGRHDIDYKEEILEAFSNGEIKYLITKPKIAGFGLNWQHCCHTTFFPSHSFERYYQAVRRFYRFGQKNKVVVDIIATEGERNILTNLQRKSTQAEEMFTKLVRYMNDEIHLDRNNSRTDTINLPVWMNS